MGILGRDLAKNMIGKKYKHFRNGNTYIVTGITFLGKEDQWGIQYIEEGKPEMVYTRPLLNFTESVELDGVLCFRFEECL